MGFESAEGPLLGQQETSFELSVDRCTRIESSDWRLALALGVADGLWRPRSGRRPDRRHTLPFAVDECLALRRIIISL